MWLAARLPGEIVSHRAASTIAKSLFAWMGLDVQRSAPKPPLDLTQPNVDPISACYLAHGAPALIRFPLRACVYENFMAFECDENSPYAKTLIEYVDKTCTAYVGSWLERLHRAFQPKSAAELMGIDNPSCAMLRETPARGALFPWDTGSPAEKYVEKVRMVEAENREVGTRLRYVDGDKFFGPCSLRKGEVEYRRLIATYESIAACGFDSNRSPNDHVSGIFLAGNDVAKGRMLIHNGQHRVAALSAMHVDSITVQLNPRVAGGVVHRGDVAFWPAVRAGYLTQREALTLFDRIIAGEPPPAYKTALVKMASQ